MRHGIHFEARHRHEQAHLGPLAKRLKDVRAGQPAVAQVVVASDFRPPHKDVWNVQIFHGLGDKGYTLNPLFLQRGWYPRVRTAANMVLRALRLPAPFLRVPERPGRRPGRYEQVNAYGPRFRDALEDMLKGVEVSNHGHVALNDLRPPRIDPEGPLLWLPTWDNRAYLGGPNLSSLGGFAHEVALVSRHVPVRVKYHPLTVAHDQDAKARAELEKEPAVTLAPAEADPYALFDGVRGVITDASSIGFEAYCLGLPIALAMPHGAELRGLHAELAHRVHVVHSGRPDLLPWAEAPEGHKDAGWVGDLLYPPSPRRNDDFATQLRSHVA